MISFQVVEGTPSPLYTDTMDIIGHLESAVCRSASYMVDFIRSGKAPEVGTKADKSLVLNLDLESQRIILDSLQIGIPIIGEEDEVSHSLVGAPECILVDPLDGTTSCKRFLANRGGQIGFGPLVGQVSGGAIVAAVFYHVPERALYTASKGHGVYRVEVEPSSPLPSLSSRERIRFSEEPTLLDCAALFYSGVRGELQAIEHLRKNNLIENAYRFGGFANDCVRVARGYEQIHVQFSVRPWDLPAALFESESGFDVIMDPLGERIPLSDWKIKSQNPMIAAPASVSSKLVEELRVCFQGKGYSEKGRLSD